MKTILTIILIYSFGLGHIAIAQTADISNKPSKKTSAKPIAEGADVWGVFEGRVACQEMAKVMNIVADGDCSKLKWGFTFFQDPKTHMPTTYKWSGSLYREKTREGKWVISKGSAADPDATVIQMDPDKPDQTFFILKGDDNVLFILDKNKKLMVGGDYLSYTFNRVVN